MHWTSVVARGMTYLERRISRVSCIRWSAGSRLITSRGSSWSLPAGHISQTFSKSISIHIVIPSGSDVKLGDSASEDIRAFLKSCLDNMGMNNALIKKALDYLVPRAAGIFIWATTVANFLKLNPEGRFSMLEKGNGKSLKGLYSLYSTIVKASFGHDLKKEEIEAVASIMGAMIFSKKPLDDDALIMLPQVKIPDSDVNRLGLIRKGLASVINSGPILHFHHRSFEDFLLSIFFQQELPEFCAVQDRSHHERQLALLCLKTLVSSKLHECNLDSSITNDVNIQPTVKSTVPPLILYSSLFWVDHLILTRRWWRQWNLWCARSYYSDWRSWAWQVMFMRHTLSSEGLRHGRCVFKSWFVINLTLTSQSLHSDNELTLFIHDALRFVSASIIPISQRAPHVYLSALPFAPEKSHIAGKFCPTLLQSLRETQSMANGSLHCRAPCRWGKQYRLLAGWKHLCFHIIHDMYVCDSETGHRISGLIVLARHGHGRDACFSPDGKHILVKFATFAVVWDIEMGEEQFQVKGSNFAFIHHDGRITSTHLVDEDGSSHNSKDEGSTRLLV